MTLFAIPGQAVTSYGPREIENQLPSTYSGSHGETVQSITFDFDTLPAFGINEMILEIPANSFIERAIWRTMEGFVGGTSYIVGLTQADGTVIDADGIFTAANLPVASIDAVGETVLSTGALVGITGVAGIGVNPGQIVVAATGTFTAGRASIEIAYRTLDDRANSND